MRALVTCLREDGQREKKMVEDWPMPEGPVGDQFKTKTLYSGVTNGSERNDLIRGNYARKDEELPATWGYQNVGEVIEVGPDVKNIKVGDVIYSSADHVEYMVIPEEWLYVKLPSNVDRKEAALFGMTSVAMRSLRHLDVRMGERLLVVGGGIIGQVAAQIGNVMGARVTLCDINEERLEMARKIGAAESVVNVDGDGWEKNIPEAGFEAILDVAGVPGMETKLILACGHRGRLAFIAGRHRVDYDFNVGQGREITIMQNSHFDNSDLENLCRLVSKGQVTIAPLIRSVMPAADAKGLYDTLRDNPAELLGTVFEW